MHVYIILYQIVPEATEMQQVLVQLLSSIKSMPLDLLIQTIHQVVKQPSLSQVITILTILFVLHQQQLLKDKKAQALFFILLRSAS